MNRYSLLGGLLTMAVACQSPAEPTTIDLETVVPKIEQLVKDYQDLDLFSGVILLAEHGEPLFEKAYGLAVRETNTPNTLQTKFILGSMNKSFTDVVLAQLLEEGKIALDDPMTKYLGGFTQPEIDQVTIGQLMDHASGFGDYHSPAFFDLLYEQKSLATIVDIARKLPLDFSPGTDRQYSNTGYILLGAIIEKVTGKSYAQNVRERIVESLGLKDTYVENIREVPDRSVGYLRTINGLEDNRDLLMEPRPDGGFWATDRDVLTFYRNFFYGDKLVRPQIREQLGFFQRIKPFYQEKGRGIPLAGGSNGINAVHLEMLADDISIVVLANMDEPVAEKIAIGILRILTGKEPDPAQLPAPLAVYEAYQSEGLAYVRDNFEALTTNFFPDDPKDLVLNNVGYNLLMRDSLDQALELFTLNAELFPEVANVWDSLGEAWRKKGNKAEALRCYRKALAIRPNLPSALQAIQELEQK